MKRAILFLVLFAVATVCMAQMTSVQAYLDDPGRETFRVAVDSLTQAIQSGENPSQTKLYLMYILDNEVSLLKEDLLAGADSLDTGGRFSRQCAPRDAGLYRGDQDLRGLEQRLPQLVMSLASQGSGSI